MLKAVDALLAMIAERVSQQYSGAVLIVSFFIILNVINYLIHDLQVYSVTGAVLLVVWMLLGMRLNEVYRRKK